MEDEITDVTYIEVPKRTDKFDELCPHCEEEVELEHFFDVHVCPNCGKYICPCALCSRRNCTNCPIEELAQKMNQNGTK
jgi:predicted RNA-binding Zn-ribbon protein involved in translation (DUF1610 family)